MIGTKSTLLSRGEVDVDLVLQQEETKRLAKVQLFAKNSSSEFIYTLDNVPFIGDVIITLFVGGVELVKDVDYTVVDIPYYNTFKTKIQIINPVYLENLAAVVRVIATRNNDLSKLYGILSMQLIAG